MDADGSLHDYEYGRSIRIGSDVWIAANVTICGGVTIGDGSVIGAGSVVTKDIPAGVLAFGNPAPSSGRSPSGTACTAGRSAEAAPSGRPGSAGR